MHTVRSARACLENHSRNLHAPLCGIFHPNSVAVAHYGALVRAKYPTNCDIHLAESIFQTRSRAGYSCKEDLIAAALESKLIVTTLK